MKRNEMVRHLIQIVKDNCYDEGFELTIEEADKILAALEKIGMKPPILPREICQAIIHVYYDGYTFNQWEEEALKDEKITKELKRRADRAALTKKKKIQKLEKIREIRKK